MTLIINKINQAMTRSHSIRPKEGGFPYLAECLKQEGIIKNIWHLPSGDSFYFTKDDSLIIPGKSLIDKQVHVPVYDEKEFIRILRLDQAGETDFSTFLLNTWKSGVIRYEVDLISRTVTYYGALGEQYCESYPQVKL